MSFSYGLDPKYKINDVADPDDGKDDAGHHHIRPHHHEKSDPHHQRHRDDDAELGLHRHTLLLYKGIQMLFVKLCAHKPVVELLGGVCKEKYRQQEKGHRGQDGKHDTDAAQTQAKESQNQKDQPF